MQSIKSTSETKLAPKPAHKVEEQRRITKTLKVSNNSIHEIIVHQLSSNSSEKPSTSFLQAAKTKVFTLSLGQSIGLYFHGQLLRHCTCTEGIIQPVVINTKDVEKFLTPQDEPLQAKIESLQQKLMEAEGKIAALQQSKENTSNTSSIPILSPSAPSAPTSTPDFMKTILKRLASLEEADSKRKSLPLTPQNTNTSKALDALHASFQSLESTVMKIAAREDPKTDASKQTPPPPTQPQLEERLREFMIQISQLVNEKIQDIAFKTQNDLKKIASSQSNLETDLSVLSQNFATSSLEISQMKESFKTTEQTVQQQSSNESKSHASEETLQNLEKQITRAQNLNQAMNMKIKQLEEKITSSSIEVEHRLSQGQESFKKELQQFVQNITTLVSNAQDQVKDINSQVLKALQLATMTKLKVGDTEKLISQKVDDLKVLVDELDVRFKKFEQQQNTQIL